MKRTLTKDSVLEDELLGFLSTKPFFEDDSPRTAPWLLCDWFAKCWILMARNGKSRKNKAGKWVDVYRIYWDRLLPNGDRLTDPQYADLLEDCRRLIYAVRSGPYATTDRSFGQYQLANNLFILINWMVIHHFDTPITYLRFSSLTPGDFDHYCENVVFGPPALEQWGQRIDTVLLGLVPTELERHSDKRGRISRKWLGHQCHIALNRTQINQFVTPLLEQYDRMVAHPGSQRRKRRAHASNRERNLRDATLDPRSSSRVEDLLQIWFHLYRQAPIVGNLVRFDAFDDIAPTRLALDLLARAKGRTPSIPTDIALYYFNAAIAWVVDYGPSLVKYTHALDATYNDVKKDDATSAFDYYAPKAFERVPIPRSLTPINISRYHAHPNVTPKDEVYKAPSVQDAQQYLISACFIIIAALTARRHDELLDLTVDCIKEEFDGLDIEFGLLKGSARDILERVTRPIPTLVKLAVDLLIALNANLRAESDDPVIKRLLFIRSDSNNDPATAVTKAVIYKYLDYFADMIDVPLITPTQPNELPYRWYIRPHECRRFLALSYFWGSTTGPSLSALSWFLCHLGHEQTIRYLQEIRKGEELSADAARATVDSLRSERGRADVQQLEQMTLTHFQADSLDWIEPSHIEAYVAMLYARRDIDFDVNDIREQNGSRHCVAITFREKEL